MKTLPLKMKNSKLIYLLLVLTVALFIYSCNQEPVAVEVNVDVVSKQIEKAFSSEPIETTSFGNRTICIDWVEGLSETRKAVVRSIYEDSGLLVEFTVCDVDQESWEVQSAVRPIIVLENDDDIDRVGYSGLCCGL